MLANSVLSNNGNIGLQATGGVVVLAKNVISGNGNGVLISGATANTYNDNYIANNLRQVSGPLTPIQTF
jgi:hypothetical protein